MSSYPAFDLGHWSELIPWKDIDAHYELHNRNSRITPEYTTSPVDMVIAESLRSRKASLLARSKSSPVDTFLFALGEPEDPSTTKVGGVPFRSPHKPWPKHDGIDLTFVAQFNFTESRDIVGSTPGELLLIYCLAEDFCTLHFEWVDIAEGSPQDMKSVACPSFEFVSCHGVRHRTVDFSGGDSPSTQGIDTLQATKIGGIPAFNGFQKDDDEDGCTSENEPEWVLDLHQVLPGRHLCSLGPVSPRLNIAFPWCNYPAPYSLQNYPKTLTLVDMGNLFVFLTEDGTVHHYFECG